MAKLIVVVLAILVCTVAATSILQSLEDEFCDNLKNSGSLFNPIRCKNPNQDLSQHGKSYKLKNPHLKADDLAPVVLLPGLGGSSLEAKLEKPDSPAWYCFKTHDWFRIWLALEELLVQTCWMDNLQVTYNPSNDTYSNTNGVEFRGLDFGGTDGIDYLDRILGFPVVSIYAPLIKSLQEVGYQSGVNLRGIPYDWRLPPTSQTTLYSQIKQLIEDTFTQNNNKKIHVVTHSMGGPTFLYFLNQMGQDWTDKYIMDFIPVAGPWAGASKALRSIVSGDNFGIEIAGFSLADQLKFRQVGRQAGGVIFMIPDYEFWEDQIFVYTPTKNYTASDFVELFNDIGTPITGTIYSDVIQIIPKLSAPGVTTHCLYGTNQTTEFFYHYETNDFDSDPTYTDYSDLGDGTVPLRSLRECQTWSKTQSQPVIIQEFNEKDHTDILEDEKLIHYILDVVTGQFKY